MRVVPFCLIGTLLFLCVARADEFTLKGGEVLRGRILGEANGEVVIRLEGGGTRTVRRSQIESVSEEADAKPPVRPPGRGGGGPGRAARASVAETNLAIAMNVNGSRSAALLAIVKFGPEVSGLLPELIELQRSTRLDANQTLWLRAVTALTPEDDSVAEAATAAVLPFLRSGDESTRLAAAACLRSINRNRPGALTLLFSRWREDLALKLSPETSERREFATYGFGAFAEDLPDSDVALLMANGGPEAIWAIGRFGPRARACVADLMVVVRRPGDWSVTHLTAVARIAPDELRDLIAEWTRADDCKRLAACGPAAASAAPRLAGLLADPRKRGPAVDALAAIGVAALPQLIETLKHTDREVRDAGLSALREIGPDAHEAIPAVDAMAQNGRDPFAHAAALTLGYLGPEAVGALSRLVSNSNSEVVDAAAGAIAHLGLDAEGAIPALLKALEAGSLRMRSPLGSVGPAALPGVIRALEHKNPEVRRQVCSILERFGAVAAEAVPSLRRRLKDDLPVASLAAQALGAMGPAAEEAVRDLIATLPDNMTAVTALSDIGVGAVPELVRALSNADKRVRTQVADALGRMGPAAVPGALRALQKALKDPEADVRGRSAYALGSLGSGGAAAIPDLKKALDDSAQIVRDIAEGAIRRIEAAVREDGAGAPPP